MAEVHQQINRKLAIVCGAFVLGFLCMLAGIAMFDSRRIVGIALAWLTGVVMYAWLTFRCRLCNTAVFNAPVGAAIAWIFQGPRRRCPRCRTAPGAWEAASVD
ncbi:MAG: hypothetical protein ACREL7_15070 [Longimicrobiales bacterium]